MVGAFVVSSCKQTLIENLSVRDLKMVDPSNSSSGPTSASSVNAGQDLATAKYLTQHEILYAGTVLDYTSPVNFFFEG